MTAGARRPPGRKRADERLRRLLAMIPWIAAHDGPTVAEVAQRFSITEAQLVADLELLFMCGLPPYTPDMLIDVDLADGRVWIRLAEYFSRPLRLTPAEGLALLAAGSAVLATPGADPEGPLARGLAKVAGVLGMAGDDGPGEVVDVALAPAPQELLGVLREATSAHHQVRLEYYAYGRDAMTTRTVEPWTVFSGAGQWYVLGWCHEAAGERLFRVDRIRSADVLDATFDPPDRTPAPAVFHPDPDDPEVVLDLAPEARWVAEQYPHEAVEEQPDGRLRVRLRVAERAWLERLLLRLGPHASVQGAEGVAAEAALRVLRRYSAGPAVSSSPS